MWCTERSQGSRLVRFRTPKAAGVLDVRADFAPTRLSFLLEFTAAVKI